MYGEVDPPPLPEEPDVQLDVQTIRSAMYPRWWQFRRRWALRRLQRDYEAAMDEVDDLVVHLESALERRVLLGDDAAGALLLLRPSPMQGETRADARPPRDDQTMTGDLIWMEGLGREASLELLRSESPDTLAQLLNLPVEHLLAWGRGPGFIYGLPWAGR